MDMNTFTTILVAVAPALASVCTIIGGLIKIVKTTKKNLMDNTKIFEEKTAKLNKALDDIAVMKAKITSIENHIMEDKK